MFSMNKTVVCVEFSKTSVFCALAQISGRKVDIIAIDHIQIDSGILEEGVIYDAPHLQQIVKNLITSVSKTHNKIDSAWIAIPDNKVLITKFEVEKDKKGVKEDDLHKAIEEKFNYSASKLHLINRPIHELNRKIFFLSNAIRIDNLDPYLDLFEPLNIPVDAVFPTFQCLFEDLKEHFSVPSLLLFPTTKGFKFFLADSDGVHLESVWGHNVIEFNENFDKAINEIIQYAKSSKEVALGVKNILVIESQLFDSEIVQKYLQRTGIPSKWIPSSSQEEGGFDPVSVIVLKGLIKACMNNEFNQGFLEPQLAHEYEYTAPIATVTKTSENTSPLSSNISYNSGFSTPTTKNTVVKNSNELDSNWNPKVIAASVMLGLAIIGLLTYGGLKVSDRISKKTNSSTSDNTVQVTPTTSNVTITPTPTKPAATATTAPTPSVTPVLADFTKEEVSVQVYNGNNTPGQAGFISQILQNNDFKTLPPQNAAQTGIPSTTVSYKDQRSKKLAEEIVSLIEPNYASAKAVFDADITDDIEVVLGVQ